MTNWIVASTLYNLEVEALASKLKPYVSSWLDSDILQKQEVSERHYSLFLYTFDIQLGPTHKPWRIYFSGASKHNAA